MSILDEIDSGLDIDALRDVAAAVNGLKRDDTGVLMVTHYKVGWRVGGRASRAPTCLRARTHVRASGA